MAGFLDKETRIVDMVLTGYGRELLSKGELQFVYWSAFDDEVDYDPPIMESASLSPQQLSASKFDQIEATLVREATPGYRRFNNSGSDQTNVFRPMFTMAQGQRILPHMMSVNGTASFSGSIEVKQRKHLDLHVRKDQFGNTIEKLGPFEKGHERYDASTFSLYYKYAPGSFPSDFQPKGFLLRMYRSGSEGLSEIAMRRDLDNELAFENELRFFLGDMRDKKRGD